MYPDARFHLLAFELLGIDGLPLPRMDGYRGDPYLTELDYVRLCVIVCQRVPGITAGDWKQAGPGGRIAYMEAALAATRGSGEQPTEATDPPDNYADYRDGPGGPLLTPKYCKKRFNVSGKDLSLDSAAKKTRLKNPGGRAGGDYVYRYDVVSLIANRKAGDE